MFLLIKKNMHNLWIWKQTSFISVHNDEEWEHYIHSGSCIPKNFIHTKAVHGAQKS